MKKVLLFLLLSILSVNLSAQRDRHKNNTQTSISTDIFGNLIYNQSGVNATLKKDIFDNVIYSDNRNNEVKYSKEHWAKLLKDFRGDREACFAWLINEYGRAANQKDEFSKDIFGNDVYKGNGYFESFKRDIFDNLIFENNEGFKASLKKSVFDDMIYSDSKGNEVKYSKEHWANLLKDFRGDEQRTFSWLIDKYSGGKNQKVEFSKNIFGDDVYKGKDGYSETFKRDIFDNLIFENNKGAKASLKKTIFDVWEYTDSNKTKREFTEDQWRRLLRKHGSEDAIFKQLVSKYLFFD